MLEKIYSIDETAEALNVSISTIRAWRFQKKLTGIKLGRRVMFSAE